MASNTFKLLCLVLIFAFVNQGYGYCPSNFLDIKLSKTGKLVQNKPEWEVRVTNTNKCKFQYVKVYCSGFYSITPVPASSLTVFGGGTCLLNAGNYIYPHVDLVFKYVWDMSYPFRVLDCSLACP